MSMTHRSIVDDLTLRTAPESWNPETREIDLVWSTGAGVMRMDWRTGTRYLEVLSMEPDAIRLERLQAGAPFLDAHRSHAAANVLGSVVPGSVVVDGGEGRCKVRLTDAEDVASAVRKVIDGSLRGVSVGYRTHAFETTIDENGAETRMATDWEPLEISAAPIQADAGAMTRDMAHDAPEVETMAGKTETVNLDEIRKQAAVDERARVAGIMASADALSVGAEEARTLIENGVSLDAAREALIAKRAEMDAQTATDTRITSGRSHDEQVREGVENAIAHRVGVASELTPAGRAHRGMSLVELGRVMLGSQGIDASRMSAREVAALCVGNGSRAQFTPDFEGGIRAVGGHTTGDFPYLLANVANNSLLDGYRVEEANFMPFIWDRDVPDFKQAQITNVGQISALPKVEEGAEYTRATFGESKETYSLATYGRDLLFTRQMMINDDLSGLQRTIRAMGSAWARTQMDLFWSILTDNAAMGDGIALFHNSHSNLGTTASIGKTPLAALRTLLRKQRGVETSGGKGDGERLNLRARRLIVPAALEQSAEDLILGVGETTKQGERRVGWLANLEVVVEPRLDDSSATAYYLAADRPFVERGLLGGVDAPFIESFEDKGTGGTCFRIRGDVGFKAADYRPITKNAGA